MAGSKALPSDPCSICNSTTYEIWFRGNHGEEWLLEKHCNRCGWAIDGETGAIRNPGNPELSANRYMQLFGGKEK